MAVEKLLGIPEDYELATMLLIGIPSEAPHTREFGTMRPDFSWLHRNNFATAAALQA